MTELQRLALDMAAAGNVSGTLSEWPELASAFRALGWSVRDTIRASAMRGLARAARAELELATRATRIAAP